MMTVPALRRRGQAHDVARLDFGKYAFERGGWDVMTFIDDDLSIRRNDVVDTVFSDEALDHRDVKPAIRLARSAPIRPTFFASMARNRESWAVH